VSGRPLHAAVLPAGPALLDRLRAALDGGPAVLPLDPALPDEAAQRLLTAMRPDMLVRPDGERQLAAGLPVPDEVAVVIATSGSTGEPKGVQLSARALRHSATAVLRRIGAGAGDRWLGCLPTSHVGGVGVLVRSLVSGTEPILLGPFSVDGFEQADAEHTAVVPTMLHRLLEAGADLGRFRTILVGGAALSADLAERARAAGAPIVATYGSTETAGGCVYDGVPLDGVTVEVGGDGRIRISGPVLADGYRLSPARTAEAFSGSWLHTDDLGRFTGDGRLEVLGRADDVIVTGGVNVPTTAVSELLSTHPAVGEVAVLGRPDEQWGELVVAVVVPADPAAPPTLDQLRAHVAARAAAAMAPRDLLLVETLPVLPSGKVDRRALGELSR